MAWLKKNNTRSSFFYWRTPARLQGYCSREIIQTITKYNPDLQCRNFRDCKISPTNQHMLRYIYLYPFVIWEMSQHQCAPTRTNYLLQKSNKIMVLHQSSFKKYETMNATLLRLPTFTSKILFLSNEANTFVYTTVSAYIFFSKMIHVLQRCRIWRCWLNHYTGGPNVGSIQGQPKTSWTWTQMI